MPFAPGATVEEQIVSDIVSTLAAINGNPNWNTSVKAVIDMESAPEELVSLPAVLVYPSAARVTYTPEKTQKNMTVFLILVIDANKSSNPRLDVQRFAADVEHALESTHTRGGYARDTRVATTEPIPRTVEDQYQQMTITLEVVFATADADPTTAR